MRGADNAMGTLDIASAQPGVCPHGATSGSKYEGKGHKNLT